MSTLANQLVLAEREDIARGVRLLLGRPLITERGDASAFELIRRRQDPLTKWFDYHCGWQLVVEPRLGYARLLKIRTAPDASRPARRPRSGRAPFDRRRYTLLCVAAAELLSVPVTTVGLLADRVVQACATDAALPPFDTANRAERMAFVDVLKLLETYGALLTVDGVTESFAESSDAKVLYRVDATVLIRLLAAPVGPSRLAVPAEEIPPRFAELLRETVREQRYGGADASETQRNLRLRHSVLRRLFDDPVLHNDELSTEELAYLSSPTGRQIVRRAAEQGGFVLEERADGLLLVDPDGIATDSRFPDDSATARVAALLLLEPLTAATGGLTPEQLTAEAHHLLRRFPQWAKGYQSQDGAGRLAADAVRVLTDFGLARRAGDRTLPRPAALRYRAAVADTAADTPAPSTEDPTR
ncbi:TIGR02678 family protein [Kitasatospora sp. NPDC048540]|uniref:TIGR02678 family protein n=1 Tax=unclassified Kitasatospora TaxID=2633591 RepID=UPI00053B13C3|nr:TIGR02678 family protein [Kitasatospora sp. MBT63]